jgi:hypothetical protein
MARDLFLRLIRAGVVLSISSEGRLSFDAPKDCLDDLLPLMLANRDDLLALVEQFEERAAIREYDGGLDRSEAERLAFADVMLMAPDSIQNHII